MVLSTIFSKKFFIYKKTIKPLPTQRCISKNATVRPRLVLFLPGIAKNLSVKVEKYEIIDL